MGRREKRIVREKVRRKRRKKRIRIMISMFILLMIIVLGAVSVRYAKNILSKISVKSEETMAKGEDRDKNSNETIDDKKDIEIEIGECRYKELTDEERLYKYDDKNDDKRYVNILVLGVDGDHKMDSNIRTNSDTMMLASYDTEVNKMNLISIPRDTKVNINTPIPKINSAYPSGGEKKVESVVEDLLDTKIDYFVKVNYSGFSKFIDAIGGVYVDIPMDMYYDDPGQDLHIYLNAGKDVYLDGQKAEQFVRWRKNNDGTSDGKGDLGRIERQQIFIDKVVKKLKSPMIVSKIKSIIDVIPQCVQTNMSPDEIINYGMEFAMLGSKRIQMHTLPGNAEKMYTHSQKKDIWYYIIDKDKISNISSLFHGEGYVDKNHIKIEVANCTDKPKLAADFTKFIKAEGYNNIACVDGKEKIDKTKIVFYGVDEHIIPIIKQEFRNSNVEINPAKNKYYDVKVFLGNDHDYIYKR